MLGKLLVPLALGGGLIWLLSSSKAQAAPSPGGAPGLQPANATYDSLPESLKQLVVQAHATQDPAMFERVAAQLEASGYRVQAQLLRAQGQQLSRARGGGAFDSLPQSLKQLVVQAHATQDPAMFELVATQLDANGYREQGQQLRAQGQALRGQPGTSVVAAVTPTTLQATNGIAPAPNPNPAIMPMELQQMVSEAIKSGTAPVLTSTAFVVERAGFPAVAEELRGRARNAAASVPAPAAKDRPDAALDPNMPGDLALEIARQLQLQGDPNALEALAREMRLRGFKNTADQLEAKASQIRATLDAARTMRDIDNEFKSPGIAMSPARSSPSSPSAASFPATSTSTPASALPSSASSSTAALPPAATPAPSIPLTVTASPEAPVAVPSTPRPQPAPAEKSRAQILADTVSRSLNELIEREGSVAKARYKEDKGMVKRFQTEEGGLTADGNYGPKTAIHVARYVSDVPPPFYWKKGTAQKDLSTYRSDLHALALDAEQLGNIDRAERLRKSAERASLA